jgi:hypothetical protein
MSNNLRMRKLFDAANMLNVSRPFLGQLRQAFGGFGLRKLMGLTCDK